MISYWSPDIPDRIYTLFGMSGNLRYPIKPDIVGCGCLIHFVSNNGLSAANMGYSPGGSRRMQCIMCHAQHGLLTSGAGGLKSIAIAVKNIW